MPSVVTGLLIEAAWNFVLVVRGVCWLASLTPMVSVQVIWLLLKMATLTPGVLYFSILC